jgi:crotonobetainyl-CoA:carnitine CoA-transferase CaiB-like acyl-CoA transferase
VNGDALSKLLQNIFLSRTAEDWIRLLEENDVPFDLCLRPGEAAQLEHLQQRQAVERGYAKFPVWANGTRGGRIRSAPPQLGEHSREILVELGFDDAQIAAMVKDGLLVLG